MLLVAKLSLYTLLFMPLAHSWVPFSFGHPLDFLPSYEMRWSQTWSLRNYSSNFSPNHLWPNITPFRPSPLAKSSSTSQLSIPTFSTLTSNTYKAQHPVLHCRLFLCSEILLFLQSKTSLNASSSLIYLLWILTGRTELRMLLLYNSLWNNP